MHRFVRPTLTPVDRKRVEIHPSLSSSVKRSREAGQLAGAPTATTLGVNSSTAKRPGDRLLD
jgi:hypothetical protein